MKNLSKNKVFLFDFFIYQAFFLLVFFIGKSVDLISFDLQLLLFWIVSSTIVLIVYSKAPSNKVVIEFFSAKDINMIITSDLIILILAVILIFIFNFRKSILIFFAFLIFIVTISRILWRVNHKVVNKKKKDDSQSNLRVLVYGAGSTGAFLVNEVSNNSQLKWNIIGFVDDNEKLHGGIICGVSVLGNSGNINQICKENNVDEIIIAMPSAKRFALQSAVSKCVNTGLKVKTVSGIDTLFNSSSIENKIVDVDVVDLLGREEIVINDSNINLIINKKNILVTGAGGSIGSELVRQILRYQPNSIVLFDISENNLYEIQQELQRKVQEGIISSEIKIETLVGSIREKDRLDYIFSKFNFNVVFHAAAHKHVPLMEDSPHEAFKNNVIGTLNLIEITNKYEVSQFINISTDKAVNPTNVMGATKRYIEMMLQSQVGVSKTNYCAVRFGNVLGSNGSVIPLFKKQIEAGGPVTVTHKDIIRYFMTIPEAVSLVLQAGTYAKGGEIFVLDMGKPVKILSLAEQLISLSGLTPYIDIDIKFTGLRPGEKLYEELLLSDEGLRVTENSLIFVATPNKYDFVLLSQQARNVMSELSYLSNEELIEILSRMIPTFVHNPNG